MRKLWGAVPLVAVLLLSACAGEPTQTTNQSTVAVATQAATPTKGPEVTFVSVVDGDTFETSDGTVRVIGIDTAENGVCGAAEASALVSGLLAAGDPIVLTLPPGQNDQDKYGRMLRYVDTASGIDVGASLIQSGLAVARYDGADGYPAHPREADYRAAQIATLAADGSVITPECQAAAEAAAAEAARIVAEQNAAPNVAPPAVDEWWFQYSSCTKLKKNTVGHPIGPFSRDNPAEASIYDWFAFGTGNNGDGEGDGLACE